MPLPDRSDIFADIRQIISEFTGVSPEKINPESDLFKDLGIAGDDADEIFKVIDEKYQIDWKNLSLGIHFGNEGFGYPLPWQLHNNCLMYEQQPCSVQDLIDTVAIGKWKGTPHELRSKVARATTYILSTMLWSFLLVVFLLSTALAISKLNQ